MKIYDSEFAPNPRRVRIFLAEKGLSVPYERIDLRAAQNRSPEFLKKNPLGLVPVLELDDGTCLAPGSNLGGDWPMAKIFFDQLTRMVDRATSGRVGRVTVECKHFFSGAAVYANGRICASLTPAGFAIKLPKESRDLLLKRRGVRPLRYFARGPVKKEYVVLPQALIDDPNGLRELLEISVAYVRRSSKRGQLSARTTSRSRRT